MGPSDRAHDPETWAAHLDALHRGTVLDEDDDDRRTTAPTSAGMTGWRWTMGEQAVGRVLPTEPGWWWVRVGDDADQCVACVTVRGEDGVLLAATHRVQGVRVDWRGLTWIAPVAPIGSVPPEVYARDVLGPFAHTRQDVERTLTAHGLTPDEAARVVAGVAS